MFRLMFRLRREVFDLREIISWPKGYYNEEEITFVYLSYIVASR